MKFKLDENFGTRTQNIFLAAGHDVQTVRQQLLHGTSDQNLYQVCKAEKRCLVTLDLDFSNVLRFPPEDTGGIVVIRTPKNPSLPLLQNLIKQFLQALEENPIENRFWIVEIDRIRIHHSNLGE